jgi:hypothetical protein
MEEVKTQNKRKLARWQTEFFFQYGRKYKKQFFDVIDLKKMESAGHLVDLTLEGMKIVGSKEIIKGDIYNFRIDLPKDVRGVHQIIVNAQCVWCKRESEAEPYYAGFRILSITPPFTEIIETLVQG